MLLHQSFMQATVDERLRRAENRRMAAELRHTARETRPAPATAARPALGLVRALLARHS